MNAIKATYNKTYNRKSDGKSAIYVYTILQRKRVQFFTGIYVLPEDWDKVNECIKSHVPNSKDWNLVINNMKARITQIFVRYKLKFENLTPDLLEYEYKLIDSSESFHTYAEFKLNESKDNIESGTYRRHKSQLTKIKEFAPDLEIKNITSQFVESYITWMRKVKKNKQTSIKSSTNVLKVYVYKAIKDRLLAENPFKGVKIAVGNSYREYLTEEELNQVHKLYISNEIPDNQKSVLRCFLFGCYTGLRLSDIKTLTLSHIRNDEILISMKKTQNSSGKIVRIPLNNKAKQLIKDVRINNIQKPLFQTICEYRINMSLKKIFVSLGLNKKISFHCSRHTFATIFLRRTNNILALKELLGHNKMEQTLIYSHLIQSDVKDAINCFDDI